MGLDGKDCIRKGLEVLQVKQVKQKNSVGR